MKVLFIEIKSTLLVNNNEHDPKCVQHLNEIITKTGCDLVFINYDLYGDMTSFHKYLIDIGLKYKYVECIRTSDNNSLPTFNSILEYLYENKVMDFAIISDKPIGVYFEDWEYANKFVLVKNNVGIKQPGIKEKIIHILNHS